MRILKEKALKSKNKNVQELVEELDEHLIAFLNDKEFDTDKMMRDVEKGKQLLEKLSELL
jgi:hypothetical protein